MEFKGVHAEIMADKTGEIDVEGARMSGKTYTISAKVWQSCQDNPGIWWLICRYSGTETDDQLRPIFMKVCRLMGEAPTWNGDEACYEFENGSKVFAYGLKTQSKDQRFAKVRGSGFAGVWNDQSEELPEDIGTEIRALVRQPDYPHQLIFSPNPPNEEHFLADQFPDDKDFPDRKYYSISLHQNAHNLPPDTIRKLEAACPPTHAKHKSLILGQRGPNVTGVPVYEGAFDRNLHVVPTEYDPTSPILEAFDYGKHHPTWVAAQLTYFGGLNLLGGIIGKRLFLDDFLPMVEKARADWFGENAIVKSCGDAQVGAEEGIRVTNAKILAEAGITLRWRENSNAPDVREAVIQQIGAMMRRRSGNVQSYRVNADPSRWLMASHSVVKQSKYFVDSLEGSFVWDENYVSVGNKTIRQPKFDQWLDGLQRCQENIVLNFISGKMTAAERADKLRRQKVAMNRGSNGASNTSPNGWMM